MKIKVPPQIEDDPTIADPSILTEAASKRRNPVEVDWMFRIEMRENSTILHPPCQPELGLACTQLCPLQAPPGIVT
jgi:hypothetical protein